MKGFARQAEGLDLAEVPESFKWQSDEIRLTHKRVLWLQGESGLE